LLKPVYDESWPELWKRSYRWDESELWGSRRDLGYSYQYRNRRNWILEAVREIVPQGGAILDIAGASGNFTLPLAEKGYRITWNDLRPEMIELVKRKYESGNVEFVPGNIFELAAQWTERFDGIVATEVIEHMAHPDEFLKAAATMLKPGGHVFLSTPNGRYFRFKLPRFSDCEDASVFESVQFKPDSDGHIFLLDRAECRMLAGRAGLDVVRLEIMTNPLTRGHVRLGHLLPFLPDGLVRALEAGTRKLPNAMREKLHCQMAAVLRKPERPA
jgi:2-polyprenyl-6-hydroxyphenyl methylase/3-demethylubiquinone-9 3-methyltransferase